MVIDSLKIPNSSPQFFVFWELLTHNSNSLLFRPSVCQMAVSVTRFPWWYLRSGKEKEPVSSGSSSSSLNSSADWGLGLRDPTKDSMKFSKGATRMASSVRKVRKKWHSREERRIDKEYDVVLVPSDGVCLSGSDTDDSDWSIGWLEPHAPDFQSDDEADDSFAVLVPCYRNDCKELKEEPSNHQFFGAIGYLPDDYSAEGKTYMEQWLSSLQNF